MPTDFYAPADIMFKKFSELYPEVAAEFEVNVDLTDFEIYLLAGILSGIREVNELQRLLDQLEKAVEEKETKG